MTQDKRPVENFKLWEQWASIYSDTVYEAMGETVEQCFKPWQVPFQFSGVSNQR